MNMQYKSDGLPVLAHDELVDICGEVVLVFQAEG